MRKAKGESNGAVAKKNVDSALETSFSDEDYQILMQLMSRFPHYSYRNILILKACCPHAQYPLRRFGTWMKYGRVVREDEKAIRICTYNGNDDKKDEEKKPRPGRGRSAKSTNSEEHDYWYQPLFDISQTEDLENYDGQRMPYTPLAPIRASNTLPFNQDVPNFLEWITILQTVSPLPISFSREISKDGILTHSDITIRVGITQLRAIRAVLTQMIHALAHSDVYDRQRKAVEAQSAVYVISERLGFETGGLLNSSQIADFADDHDKDEQKAFLNSVQKIAMYLIDSIEGEREARRIGFDTGRVCLLLERKTAARMFRLGHSVWLVGDDLSLKPADSKSAIDKSDGPFAVERAVWFGDWQLAA